MLRSLLKRELQRQLLAWGLPVVAAVGALLALLLVVLVAVSGVLTSLDPDCGTKAGAQTGQVPSNASEKAKQEIPPEALRAYASAGKEYGIPWHYLAGHGQIETQHGTLKAPGVTSGVNFYGCCSGPMQFYITPWNQLHPSAGMTPQVISWGRLKGGSKGAGSTWAAYGVDKDGDGVRDVWNISDSIHSAAKYLVASGAKTDIRKAMFAYNHDWGYVADVLAAAKSYTTGGSDTNSGGGTVVVQTKDDPAPSGDSLTSADTKSGTTTLVWPTKPAAAISSPFGPRWGRMHEGLDFGLPVGTPIYAAAAGRVNYASAMGAYGNYVCVTHTRDFQTCYAHNSKLLVKVGQTVKQGQRISLSGNTGRSTGPHLHFEVRRSSVAAGDPAVDPKPFLSGAAEPSGTEEVADEAPEKTCGAPTVEAGNPAQGDEILHVGDSLAVGTNAPLKRLVGETDYDGKVGRSSTATVASLKALIKDRHKVVIFDAGTNDGSNAAALRASLRSAKAAAGDRDLIVLTVLSPPNTAKLNAVIRASGAKVLDWQGLVKRERIALDSMGIHPSGAGYAKRAELIADAIETEAAGSTTKVGATGRALPTGVDSNGRLRGKLGGGPGVGTHSRSASPNNWQSDNAVDILIPAGTPLYAVSDGVVCDACGFGMLDSSTSSRFGGLRFTLTAEDGIDWYYSHLKRMAVRRGQRVKKGQLVGYSGVANGVPHLHLASSRGNPLDLLGLRA